MRKNLLLILAALCFVLSSYGQGFKVCGSKIYDPTGKEFIVKGTNAGGPGWVWPENTVGYFDHIVKWKFNTIRLVTVGAPTLDSYTSFQCPKTNWPQYKYTTFGTMREIIKKYTDAKIVVLIDWQEVGGIYTDLNCAKNWWTMLANEYKSNPYVWFDMYNEPNTSKASWASNFQTIINAIRGTGNNNIIVASGNYWAQEANSWSCSNVSDANSAILTSTLSDPAGNLVYSIHTYDQWMQCQAKLDNFLDRVIAQGKCIILGEYGIYNNSYVRPAEDYSLWSTQARKVGRIEWAFWGGDNNDLTTGGNGGGQNSTYDSNGNCTNLSTFGQKVWNDNRRVESLGTLPASCGGSSDTQAPTTPGSLAAGTATTTSIPLSWTASTDNVGVTGYNIYNGTTLITTVTTTSYTVSGLTCNASYTFGVSARDAAGNESAKATVSKTTVACSSPTEYQAESYTSQSGTTIETLNAGYSGTGYVDYGGNGTWMEWNNVNVSTTGSKTLTFRYANGSTVNRTCEVKVNGVSIGSLSFAPTSGWTNWTTAYITATLNSGNNTIRIAATTSSGGPNIDRMNIEGSTSDTQAPTTPTNLAAGTATEASIPLSWTASIDNVGVTGYKIYNGSTLITTVTTTSYSVSGLNFNTSYTLYVSAIDAAGNESAKTSIAKTTATCSDTQVPTTPTGLTSSNITQTSFTLSWTASTDNVGVTGYEVFAGGVSMGITSSTSMSIPGLTCNTAYSMTVKARDAAGNWSAASTALNVMTSACTTTSTVYQGENYTSQSGTTIQTLDAGYTGTGYVDYGGSGTWIEWNNVNASTSESFTLTFRYANGSTVNRTCEVKVNGVSVSSISFAPTSGWANWTTVSIAANLNSGNNTIRVTATTSSGGPSLDKMDVATSSQSRLKSAKINSIEKTGLLVYPNPASDIINIQMSAEGATTINIYKIAGELVYSNVLNGNINEAISTTNFGAGLYMLKVVSGDNSHLIKLVIK